MNFIRQVERFQLLSKLIGQEQTSSPDSLARRLGVSRRQLYCYIEDLRMMGLEVSYSKKSNSFRFEENKMLEIHFKMKVVDKDEHETIYGGGVGNVFPCFFSARYSPKLPV